MSPKKIGKKKFVSKKVVLEKTSDLVASSYSEMNVAPVESVPPVPTKKTKPWMILVPSVVLLLAFLLFLNRNLFLVATINGSPVFRWDFNAMMESRFGKQTLEGLISERLIVQEANKAGVTIEPKEVDEKVSEVLKNLGTDVSLDELLAFQGLTKDDFTNQIKLQLTVEKLLGKDIQITDNDITNFIATNRAILKATSEAALKDEARKLILERGISSKLQSWFTEIRSKAAIEKFIK